MSKPGSGVGGQAAAGKSQASVWVSVLKERKREAGRPFPAGPGLLEAGTAEGPDCGGPSNQMLLPVARPAFLFLRCGATEAHISF